MAAWAGLPSEPLAPSLSPPSWLLTPTQASSGFHGPLCFSGGTSAGLIRKETLSRPPGRAGSCWLLAAYAQGLPRNQIKQPPLAK